MTKSKGRQKPIVTHSGSDSESDHRHKVVKSSKKPRFRFGQQVCIVGQDGTAQDGPYNIERVIPPSSSKPGYRYTLCDVATSLTVWDGATFEESQLVKAG
ncbi:hypothetical protein OQA88_825 [Cercophora sp. LCS_1]